VPHPSDQDATLPYILDIIPHVQVGDISPVESFKAMLQRWPEDQVRPHIVGDAAFGSLDMMSCVAEWGGTATLSCGINNCAWLWDLLSTDLPPATWRCAVNEDSIIASVHVATDDRGNKGHQQILASGWTATVRPESNAAATSANTPTMPHYTAEALGKLKVVELRQICKKYGIKQGKKKANFVEIIAQRSATVHQHASKVERLQSTLKTRNLPDPAPLHNFYREYFNLVDLADRRWYTVEEHHKHQRWQTKMALAILRDATMNAWVYAINLEYADWLSWRETLSLELMSLQ